MIVGSDDKGEPLKKRAKLNEDGTRKQTRNEPHGKDDAEQTALFWSHFPRMPEGSPRRKEGCSCRPLHTYGWDFLLGAPHPSRSARKHEGIEGDEDAGELLRSLTPGNPRPMARKPGQQLVAIDPGRRDINYVETDEAQETPSTCTSSTSKFLRSSQFFGISTRQHVKEAKRRRIATLTVELQKRSLLSAEVFLGGWGDGLTGQLAFGLAPFTVE